MGDKLKTAQITQNIVNVYSGIAVLVRLIKQIKILFKNRLFVAQYQSFFVTKHHFYSDIMSGDYNGKNYPGRQLILILSFSDNLKKAT